MIFVQEESNLNKNVNVTLRETKGQDIAAACGQLKAKKQMDSSQNV